MPTAKFKIVEDNTAPPYQLTLKRDGAVIDLTGCTVKVYIAKGATQTNTGHETATVTTPTSGLITYTAQSGDFPNPGTYKADVEVIYGDLTVERLYDQAQFKVRKKI